jgi:hypothetical protein
VHGTNPNVGIGGVSTANLTGWHNKEGRDPIEGCGASNFFQVAQTQRFGKSENSDFYPFRFAAPACSTLFTVLAVCMTCKISTNSLFF